MYTYRQSTGVLTNKDGIIVATGYSGHGEGRNNPLKQDVQNVGPIPQSIYFIGQSFKSPTFGPKVMRLTPLRPLTNKRAGFLIHGNDKENDASHGCIVLGPNARQFIATHLGQDNTIKVIA